MAEDDCPLCAEQRGGGPFVCPVIHTDDLIVVTHRATGSLGYVFIETARDVPYVHELTDAEAAAVGRIRSRVAAAMAAELPVEHVFTMVVGTGVAHFHEHVFVRHVGTHCLIARPRGGRQRRPFAGCRHGARYGGCSSGGRSPDAATEPRTVTACRRRRVGVAGLATVGLEVLGQELQHGRDQPDP